MKWDNYFLDLCDAVAAKSKDPRRKIGCVIVGSNNEIRSTGYNGFPSSVRETELRYKEDKYMYMVHAEVNAIYNAAKCGTSTDNCTIYINRPPCNECAKAIIQSGIKRVVVRPMPDNAKERWKRLNNAGYIIMKEVVINYIIKERESVCP